jgi:DNA adenine methylase
MGKRLHSIVWVGGKGMMVAKILPLFPPHTTYVEVFGGAASLLLAKKPSPVEVYNDVDGGLVNFFKVISDPDKFEKFHRKVALLPYSRELYYECVATWEEQADPVEKAWRWYVVGRQSFGGLFGSSWGYGIGSSTAERWVGAIKSLPDLHRRFQNVQVEHNDFRKVIPAYDSPNTFFYLDPPYVQATRKTAKVYKHETTNKDHRRLVKMLLGIKGTAILSGYASDMYKPLEDAGWVRKDWNTVCYVAGHVKNSNLQGKGAVLREQKRVESVWVSPRRLKEGLRRGL